MKAKQYIVSIEAYFADGGTSDCKRHTELVKASSLKEADQKARRKVIKREQELFSLLRGEWGMSSMVTLGIFERVASV